MSINIQKTHKGKTTILNPNTFTREGYDFVGWNTERDGSGISYLNGQTVEEGFEVNPTNLYAQWSSNVTKINYTFTLSSYSPDLIVETTTDLQPLRRLSDVIDFTWEVSNKGNLIHENDAGTPNDYRTVSPDTNIPTNSLTSITNPGSILTNTYTEVRVGFKPKVKMRIAYDGTKFPTNLRTYNSIESFGTPDTNHPQGSGGGYYTYRGKDAGSSYNCGFMFSSDNEFPPHYTSTSYEVYKSRLFKYINVKYPLDNSSRKIKDDINSSIEFVDQIEKIAIRNIRYKSKETTDTDYQYGWIPHSTDVPAYQYSQFTIGNMYAGYVTVSDYLSTLRQMLSRLVITIQFTKTST